jgi:hypothetical protein
MSLVASALVCVLYNENRTFDRSCFATTLLVLMVDTTTVIAQVRGWSVGDALATWFETPRTIEEAESKNFLGGMPTETSTALSKLCSDSILLKDSPSVVEALEAKPVTPQRLRELLKLTHF